MHCFTRPFWVLYDSKRPHKGFTGSTRDLYGFIGTYQAAWGSHGFTWEFMVVRVVGFWITAGRFGPARVCNWECSLPKARDHR